MTPASDLAGRSSVTPIRIVVVDDHPVVRAGLIAMLETQSDFQVLGEGSSGPDALALVQSHDPDVLLLDLELPQLDGLHVLKQLRAEGARARVIVFTVFDTDERIIGSVEAGAAGYLLKGAPRADVFAAVRTMAAGGSLLAPVAASALLRRVRQDAEPRPQLTPRELDVLQHLARGLGNKRIASALGISERTVKFHMSAVFAKLGASNRTDALTRAAQAGIIRLQQNG
ncbi:MAG: response regulator [Longimicrobiales bacterium]